MYLKSTTWFVSLFSKFVGLSKLTTLNFKRNNLITAQGIISLSSLINLVKLDLERCPKIQGGLIHLKGLCFLNSMWLHLEVSGATIFDILIKELYYLGIYSIWFLDLSIWKVVELVGSTSTTLLRAALLDNTNDSFLFF